LHYAPHPHAVHPHAVHPHAHPHATSFGGAPYVMGDGDVGLSAPHWSGVWTGMDGAVGGPMSDGYSAPRPQEMPCPSAMFAGERHARSGFQAPSLRRADEVTVL
jgi:hypothetical protein